MNTSFDRLGIVHRDQVDALVTEAVAAAENPALDSQFSWRFSNSGIEMHSPPDSAGSPERRSMLLQGGAVLLNLRILLRGLGVQPLVRILPDTGDQDLVATIRLEQPRSVSEPDRALVAAVLSRAASLSLKATSPPRTEPMPSVLHVSSAGALLSPLRRAVKTEQAWLAVQQLPDVHAAAWLDAGSAGMFGTALIVGTVLDGPGAQLQAGQAAQRAILTAATLGAATTSVPQLLQPEHNRIRIRGLIGGGLWPQAVLQLDGPGGAGD